MFVGRYFSKVYFTDDYFPDSNGGVVGDTSAPLVGMMKNPGTLLGRR